MTALSYGAQAVNKANQLPYYVELYVFDFGNTVQSVLVTSGSKKHLGLYDSLWQPIIAGAKKPSNQPQVTPANSPAAPFSGQWAKSQSSPYGIDPGSLLTNAGYMKCQYDFKPGGTYTLRGESWGGYMRANDYTVLQENGKYTITGNQLVIIPASSKLYSTDGESNLKKTTALDASKRTYTWQLHYFEGLNETQLVLTPVKAYFQDGGFSSGGQFTNAYLYSTTYKPEWRITPK